MLSSLPLLCFLVLVHFGNTGYPEKNNAETYNDFVRRLAVAKIAGL